MNDSNEKRRPLAALNNDLKHAYAAFLSAAEAVRQTGRDWHPVRDGRRYRLQLGTTDTYVQVFGRFTAGDWPLDTLAENTSGVVFVEFDGDEPSFYVVLKADYGRDIAQWRDRWDQIP